MCNRDTLSCSVNRDPDCNKYDTKLSPQNTFAAGRQSPREFLQLELLNMKETQANHFEKFGQDEIGFIHSVITTTARLEQWK